MIEIGGVYRFACCLVLGMKDTGRKEPWKGQLTTQPGLPTLGEAKEKKEKLEREMKVARPEMND